VIAGAILPRRLPAGRILLLAPALVVGAMMVAPLVYLVLRALQADAATVLALLARPRTLQLLLNTAALAAGVLAFTTAIALPLAWLTTRTDLAFRRTLNVLAVLPLAVPGYVMAYALIGLSGNSGFMNQVLGVTLPRPEGWLGATLALTLYTYPYLYLNLRAAFSGLDQTLEESARALGCTPVQVFTRVTLPHLMPAMMAGWLLIGLYTIGDFGAVALMRYEVFSYALYLAYSASFDRLYAAWIALILVAIALAVVWWESRLRAGMRYARTGSGSGARFRRTRLSPLAAAAAWAFVALVVLAALGLPVAVLTFWLLREPLWPVLPELARAFGQSLSVAAPAAVLAAADGPAGGDARRAPPLAALLDDQPPRLRRLRDPAARLRARLRLPRAAGRALPLPDPRAARRWSTRSPSSRWRSGRSGRRSTRPAPRSRTPPAR
jgi:iron(III) transport system permease protein